MDPGSPWTLNVSILTQSYDRVQRTSSSMPMLVGVRFNPHPVLRPGATRVGLFLAVGADLVSILTQSYDRVQRWSTPWTATPRSFQSSPSLTTGCNGAVIAMLGGAITFQSSPSLTTGCNYFRPGVVDTRSRHHVSILTQSYDRVQRLRSCTMPLASRFQSSPSLTTGCNPRRGGP